MKLNRDACQPVFLPYLVDGEPPAPGVALEVSLDGGSTWLPTAPADGGAIILLAGHAYTGSPDPSPAATLAKGKWVPKGRVALDGAPAVVDVAPDAIYVD